jgi:hypothetical protein
MAWDGMDRGHVLDRVRPAVCKRDDVICFVAAWHAAHVANRVVALKDVAGALLLA